MGYMFLGYLYDIVVKRTSKSLVISNYDVPALLFILRDLLFGLKKNILGALRKILDIPENSQQEKMQKYTKKILQISERIVVPSEYFKVIVEEKYSPKAKIFVYPSGGIDSSLFYPYDAPTIKKVKKQFDVDNNKPTIGMACRISQGKGWDTFVEAIYLLGEDKNRANFILVGSGPYDKDLDEMIEKKGLQNTIKRYGLLPQNELADFYNALSFYSSSSSRLGESLGLVIIEAMACGKPVISADFAAPMYYVTDGVNGYKFKVGDAYAMSIVLHKAIDDYYSEKYMALCTGAYETAVKYFDINQRDRLAEIFS